MNNRLLPLNASAAEIALEGSMARISDVPVLVRESWNPDTCPESLLPWLAWAFSVDEWNADWTEAEKRQVIKSALYVHKHKGTLGALKRAIEPLGYIIRIVEWHEETPPGPPYTFRLEVGVNDKGVDETIYDQMVTLIEAYKNVRSHMLALTIKGEVAGSVYMGAALMSGCVTEVYPYFPDDMESIGPLYFGAAEQSCDTVSIFPIPRTLNGSWLLDGTYKLDGI